MGSTTPPQSQLAPPDWDAIYPHYQAGVRSIQQLGRQFGVSHTAIIKHAKKHGWARNLRAKIDARAEELVSAAQVTSKVSNSETTPKEKLTVEVNAQIQAEVYLAHRHGSTEARDTALALLAEVSATTTKPELFAQVIDMLSGDTEVDAHALRQLVEHVSGTPGRAKVLKDALDCVDKAFVMERRSYGMDERQKPPEDADSFESLRDLAEKNG